VRESLKDREREEREREPVCVCVRERDIIRSQCPAGSASRATSPGRRFNADHVPTDTSPGCQHNTNMDNGMITTNMPT